jgi:hypothetical protein
VRLKPAAVRFLAEIPCLQRICREFCFFAHPIAPEFALQVAEFYGVLSEIPVARSREFKMDKQGI